MVVVLDIIEARGASSVTRAWTESTTAAEDEAVLNPGGASTGFFAAVVVVVPASGGTSTEGEDGDEARLCPSGGTSTEGTEAAADPPDAGGTSTAEGGGSRDLAMSSSCLAVRKLPSLSMW